VPNRLCRPHSGHSQVGCFNAALRRPIRVRGLGLGLGLVCFKATFSSSPAAMPPLGLGLGLGLVNFMRLTQAGTTRDLDSSVSG